MELLSSDYSALEGTCCYCSDEAAQSIRQAIKGLPLCAVHFLGTGDYHYQTLFWLERIGAPFALVHFDNHPDDQAGAFGEGILSCGSWVANARRLANCRAASWFDGSGHWQWEAIPEGLPVYLSVDLDVLGKEYLDTDWDQGSVAPAELASAIQEATEGRTVLGIDVCGGPAPVSGASDFSGSLALTKTILKKFL